MQCHFCTFLAPTLYGVLGINIPLFSSLDALFQSFYFLDKEFQALRFLQKSLSLRERRNRVRHAATRELLTL